MGVRRSFLARVVVLEVVVERMAHVVDADFAGVVLVVAPAVEIAAVVVAGEAPDSAGFAVVHRRLLTWTLAWEKEGGRTAAEEVPRWLWANLYFDSGSSSQVNTPAVPYNSAALRHTLEALEDQPCMLDMRDSVMSASSPPWVGMEPRRRPSWRNCHYLHLRPWD